MWYVVTGLVCFFAGYFLKDQLTDETKIIINKPKLRGKGNTVDSDLDIKVEKVRKKLFNGKKDA